MFMRSIAIAAALLALAATDGRAGMGESGFWLTGTGFYSTGKNTQSGSTVDGAGVAGTLEGMRGANVSLGLSLGYASMTTEGDENGEPKARRVTTMPAYLVLRYWFGDGDAEVRPYLGAGAGVYISFLDTTDLTTGRDATLGTSGFAGAIPVGLIMRVGPRMALNVNYTLNWMADNDFLDNGLVHVVGAGLGFTLSP